MGFRFILAAQDVYTRRLYLEPLVGKTPDLILPAYKRIERRAGASPSVLTSDQEAGVLAEPMQNHLLEVGTNFRQKRALNDTAILDNAIKQVRTRLAKLRVRLGLPQNRWGELVHRVERGQNNEDKEALYGESAAEASAAVGLAAPEETPVVGPTTPESIDGEDLEELSMPLAQK